jgi:hypothetical protein
MPVQSAIVLVRERHEHAPGKKLPAVRVAGELFVLSLGAARLFSTLLFGVPPHDLRVLATSVGLLFATALAANWLPAVRAARVDPMATLRAD